MDVKHIYWFCYFDASEPSVRYRAIYPLEELEKEYGISSSLVLSGYSPGRVLHFFKVCFSVLLFRKSNSLLVFQKLRTNRFYSAFLKTLLLFRRKYTLYDIDDADYLKFSEKTIQHFMTGCATCSVGSRALYDYAFRYNRSVLLLTSPVIMHSEIKEYRNEVITVGWIGYYNAHRHSLQELFFPALDNISFKVRLVLLGVVKEEHFKELKERFSGNDNVSLEMPAGIDWQDETSIYRKIKEFDIGISPLLDTERNRSKSAFKLKQYLSCGVPVLGSSLGENKVFIKEGVNGFVCETPTDYRDKIESIHSMSNEQYDRMCSSALATCQEFNVKKYCADLLAYFRKL